MRNRKIALRIAWILCIFALLSTVSPVISAADYGRIKNSLLGIDAPAACFPSNLKIIGDEAFYGTSINTVFFYDNLVYIGEKVFKNANCLTDVFIPEITAHIGQNAFPEKTIIHGVEGSYVQQWAEELAYRFIADDAWNTRS